jgi:hypothetical protein
MKKLYRVIAKTTDSLRPSRDYNVFETTVLYCGFDRDEALVAYHKSTPLDYSYGYGNRYRKTVAKSRVIPEGK